MPRAKTTRHSKAATAAKAAKAAKTVKAPEVTKPAEVAKPNDGESVFSLLREHAGVWISDREIEVLKDSITVRYYRSLPNSNFASPIGPGERYFLADGKEIAFKDVPLAKEVVPAIEVVIGCRVPTANRTDVYHKVLSGMPGHKEIPEWDTKIPSAFVKPMTPFSQPRDATVSNKELLDALVSAAGLDEETAKAIGGQITWWDAMGDGSVGCSLSGGSWDVSGGRLGRNHTIIDVPINYFRDRLMDWIAESIKDEDQRSVARKAICPDLTDTELAEYARLIAEDRVRMDEEAARPLPPLTREEQVQRMLDARVVQTRGQAMKIVLMNEAVREIDSSIDYETPKPMGIFRDYGRGPKQIEGSVVTPHWAPLHYETELATDMEVDRDCDQVRAMINILCAGFSDWSAETFREALGSTVTRERLTAFLKKRGTDAHQLKSAAYLLSWEFFNRREQLGLSIVEVDFRDDLETLKERLQITTEQRELNESHKEAKLNMMKALLAKKKSLDEVHEKRTKAMLEAHDERFAALEAAQAKEMRALRLRVAEARRLGKNIRDSSVSEEDEADAADEGILSAGEEAEAKAADAAVLAEASPKRLNKKRASDGINGGPTKRRTRSSMKAAPQDTD